jgi:heme-degrading monooxygenase HmoA
MHAVIVHVNLDPSRHADALRLLEEQVVPNAERAPGFLDGYWMRSDDGSRGLSIELFDTRDAAEAFAASAQTVPSDSPASIDRVEVFEVVAST